MIVSIKMPFRDKKVEATFTNPKEFFILLHVLWDPFNHCTVCISQSAHGTEALYVALK